MAKKDKLTHRIHTRITKEKYEELTVLLAQCRGIKSLSELLRDILSNRKINIQNYDRSLDTVMEQLSSIRTELHAIGVNINQVTRRFHAEKLPEARLLQVMEIEQQYRDVGKKVDRLFEIIQKLSARWLPG